MAFLLRQPIELSGRADSLDLKKSQAFVPSELVKLGQDCSPR
jgi:hypothetical protein